MKIVFRFEINVVELLIQHIGISSPLSRLVWDVKGLNIKIIGPQNYYFLNDTLAKKLERLEFSINDIE